MSDILLTREEVSAAIRDKTPTGTSLKAAQIAEEWDSQARQRAMFSARVTQADILAGFQRRIQQVVDGTTSRDQARDWMTMLLESKGDSALAAMGFKGVDESRQGSIQELASQSRLLLIVDQNVMMAHATAEYQKMQEGKESYPFVEYHTAEDGRVRESHAELDKKLFKVDSDEAALLWPPNGFRCRCRMIPRTAADAKGRKVEDMIPPGYLEAKAKDPDPFSFDPRNSQPSAMQPREAWGKEAVDTYVRGTTADIDVEADYMRGRRDYWLKEAGKAKKPSAKKTAEDAVANMDERLARLADERAKVQAFGDGHAGKQDAKKKAEAEAKAKAEADKLAAELAKAEADFKAREAARLQAEAEAKRIAEEAAKAAEEARKAAEPAQAEAEFKAREELRIQQEKLDAFKPAAAEIIKARKDEDKSGIDVKAMAIDDQLGLYPEHRKEENRKQAEILEAHLVQEKGVDKDLAKAVAIDVTRKNNELIDREIEDEAKNSRLSSLAYESERFKQLKAERMKELLSSGVSEEVANQKAVVFAENEAKEEIKKAEAQRKRTDTLNSNKKDADDAKKEKERIDKEKEKIEINRVELLERSKKAYIASLIYNESPESILENSKIISDIVLGLMVVNQQIEMANALNLAVVELQNNKDELSKKLKAKEKRKKKS